MNRGTLGHVFRRVSVASELLRAILVLLAIVGTTALLLFLGGFPVRDGLAALWRGSLGSWYAFTSSTLVRAVPLMLTGVAVAPGLPRTRGIASDPKDDLALATRKSGPSCARRDGSGASSAKSSKPAAPSDSTAHSRGCK